MSQFAFVQREWPSVYESAVRAEVAAHRDPRTSCFYARRALEIAVAWAYKHDPAPRLPYDDRISALIHEPTFKQAAGEAVFSKARVINTLGNRAVHGHRDVPQDDAVVAVRELFHLCLPDAWDPPHRRGLRAGPRPQGAPRHGNRRRQDAHGDRARRPAHAVQLGEAHPLFDLLILYLQLAQLRSEPSFTRLRDQVKEIAGLLEEKSAIPMIRALMPLIQDVQSDEWWQDVTVAMLEVARRRLRDLVRLIEKQRRNPICTDFEDEMGPETAVVLPGIGSGTDFERFRAKAQAYLRAHLDHIAIQKLRRNRALTSGDLAELERMLAESGVGSAEDIARAKAESHGLGLFVRSLVGLDREAAKEALATFQSGKTLSANQIDFVNLIIDHLTEHGVMEAKRLYESPFTDVTPHGPEGLFNGSTVDELIAALDSVKKNAAA
jgi:type I restriction enzyme R subunit